MSYRIITNHGALAVELLPTAWRKPRVEALVKALAAPVQVVEDFAAAIFTGYNITTATMPQLGHLAALVGESPGTLSDSELRRVVQGKARALRSTGAVADIYATASLLAGEDATVRVTEVAACYYEVLLLLPLGSEMSTEMRARARRVLDKARPAGWGSLYLYGEGGEPFGFDGYPPAGYDAGHFVTIL